MTPATPQWSGRPILGIVVVLFVTGGILGIWWYVGQDRGHSQQKIERAPADDPRLTYDTPYKNVHPDVKYVGNEACAECHTKISNSYHHHPMGQTLAPIEKATPIEVFTASAKNPFDFRTLEYAVLGKNDQIIHQERAKGNLPETVKRQTAVQYSVGSGARARSYITNHDGFLFQSPITWFPMEQRWDISPGYENRNLHFSRPITPQCLFCHCNYADHVANTVNQYREPIFLGFEVGCERCHGPGELHVKSRQNGERPDGLDTTIVNPAKLTHSLQLAVCEQCHIQGEQRVVCRGRSDFDFRPGLPLHLFLMDFVNKNHTGGDHKFVSSVEQLRLSRCYKESSEPNKLTCITCHDPHWQPKPEEKAKHYRQRCLTCHGDNSCSLPINIRKEKHPNDSCIACHMPNLGSEIRHTAITDHTIPRLPDRSGNKNKTKPPPPGPDDLVPYHQESNKENSPEVERNLAMAQLGMFDLSPPDAIKGQFAQKALPLLQKAVQRDPEDWPAQENLAMALRYTDQKSEAMELYREILKKHPKSETVLGSAGFLALTMNDHTAAQEFFRRAIEVNPWRWHYYHGQATASFRLKQWERALSECQKSLELEPARSATRSLMVQCYLCLGNQQKAQEEFAVLRELTVPERRNNLQQWYEQVKTRFGQ